MPTNFQTRRQWLRYLAGSFSAGLGLLVLILLILSAPELLPKETPARQKIIKPVPKSVPNSVPRKEVKPPKMIAPVRQEISLPAPPKLSRSRSAKKPKTARSFNALKPHPKKSVVKKNIAIMTPLKPKPRPNLKPKLVRPKIETHTEVVRSRSMTKKMVEKGRTLLRLLEHGSGPRIEFAWPDAASERKRLYQVLVRCHGMRVALLDDQDRLFITDSRPGEKWQINLDFYSTFLRQIAGRMVELERLEVTKIQRRQSKLGTGMPVRIFTRVMDAYVLGSLGQILGSGYRSKSVIHARYELSGSTIRITNIVADGLLKSGQITIPCTGRRGA